MLGARRMKPILVAVSVFIVFYYLTQSWSSGNLDVFSDRSLRFAGEDDSLSDLSADKKRDLIQRLRSDLESHGSQTDLPLVDRTSNMSALVITPTAPGQFKIVPRANATFPTDVKGEEKWSRNVTQVRLILLAYMRTGSSMTGSILKHHKSVFYWYEPLHSLERYFTSGGHTDQAPQNIRAAREEFTKSTMAAGNISDILQCDIARVYRGILLDNFLASSKAMGQHHICFSEATSAAAWNACAHTMSESCKRDYRVVALKTIRFHMVRALELLRDDSEVRIVHLVRDPRAVLLSRRKLGFCNWEDLANEAYLLCWRMYRDLKLALMAQDTLRGRYILKRYEDTAWSPMEAMNVLYRFVGLVSSESDRSFVKNLTLSAKKTKPCPTCKKVKQTSKEVSQTWRNIISLNDAQTISAQCHDVMALLGYRIDFSSEKELRNLTVSAVQKPDSSIAEYFEIF